MCEVGSCSCVCTQAPHALGIRGQHPAVSFCLPSWLRSVFVFLVSPLSRPPLFIHQSSFRGFSNFHLPSCLGDIGIIDCALCGLWGCKYRSLLLLSKSFILSAISPADLYVLWWSAAVGCGVAGVCAVRKGTSLLYPNHHARREVLFILTVKSTTMSHRKRGTDNI